jgi:hypothetical protein
MKPTKLAVIAALLAPSSAVKFAEKRILSQLRGNDDGNENNQGNDNNQGNGNGKPVENGDDQLGDGSSSYFTPNYNDNLYNTGNLKKTTYDSKPTTDPFAGMKDLFSTYDPFKSTPTPSVDKYNGLKDNKAVAMYGSKDLKSDAFQKDMTSNTSDLLSKYSDIGKAYNSGDLFKNYNSDINKSLMDTVPGYSSKDYFSKDYLGPKIPDIPSFTFNYGDDKEEEACADPIVEEKKVPYVEPTYKKVEEALKTEPLKTGYGTVDPKVDYKKEEPKPTYFKPVEKEEPKVEYKKEEPKPAYVKPAEPKPVYKEEPKVE